MPEGVYLNEKNHLRYTKSNWERMHQVLSQTVLHQKLYNLLADLHEKWIWLISEPWCGDASWGTPALYMISKASENIDFRILLRDTNTTLIKAYQTNGGNSIPKLICLKANGLKELGTWGPSSLFFRKWLLYGKTLLIWTIVKVLEGSMHGMKKIKALIYKMKLPI